MKTGTIYGLLCPVKKDIVYVGQTTRELKQRLRVYFYKRSTLPDGLKNWLSGLSQGGLLSKIEIVPIEEGVLVNQLNNREAFWISAYKIGGNLLNIQAAGYVNRETPRYNASAVSIRRYFIIDRLLRTGQPTLKDFIGAVNSSGINVIVNKRSVQGDIEAMRYDSQLGFHAPIVYCKKIKAYKYSADYSLLSVLAEMMGIEISEFVNQLKTAA